MMRAMRIAPALAAETFDLLGLAALAVDAQGRLLYCNAAAARLLHEGRCLARRKDMLSARDGRTQEALEHLMREALSDKRGAAILSHPGSGQRLLAITARLERHAAIALFVVDPRAGADAALIAQIFGLTSAEARLASALGSGTTLGQQAAASGVSMSTVRTQLRHVLAKTGTRRQAELARLLACLPALREAPPRTDQASGSSANGGPPRARRTTSA
jgi:DNA-binding CsgD family transcriptional regulator